MKKEKWDGQSRPSNDLYRKNFDEIFGDKDLKGTTICKAKKCDNYLYKNESPNLKVIVWIVAKKPQFVAYLPQYVHNKASFYL